MKFLSILPLVLLIHYFMMDKTAPPKEASVIRTGIYLDSMGNEVILKMKNDYPAYYYCEAFTPVCNTGECLPVYVNFYWDLKGNYVRFDQPEGEILTKLDHEPFTPSDYDLLREILSGPDPRYESELGVKHFQPNQGSSQGDNQANAAPTQLKTLSKYEMVDGVTGATLPEIKDKFVPGALYTTYTLWGLANDHSSKMLQYTKSNLFTRPNIGHFLMSQTLAMQAVVIDHLSMQQEQPQARAKALCAILDTANAELSKTILKQIYYSEYQTEVVELSLHNKFYNSTDAELRKAILSRWANYFISESSLKMLAVNLHTNQDLIQNILLVFTAKQQWPAGVFENLVNEMDKLKPENQQLLLETIQLKKDLLTSEQRKTLKSLEKRY